MLQTNHIAAIFENISEHRSNGVLLLLFLEFERGGYPTAANPEVKFLTASRTETMTLFCNDYLEGCHPDILNNLQETNLCQTEGYGKDPYCEKARLLIKDLCGRPDADVHFMVGGTQTNAAVIASVLRPHQGVLCADTGHINVHESGAIEHSGHKVLSLPSNNGKISARQIDETMKAHSGDPGAEHCVQPGMVYLSFPTELGTVYTKDELTEMRKVCSEWGIPLYIDGARLGYGLESSGCDVTLKDIARLTDIFYIGGTKQGMLFGEAVVICNDTLKKDFRYIIKQNGGLLAKGRLIGIQFQTMFSDGLYFSLARNADRLAEKLTVAFKEKGYRIYVDSSTNQVFPILPSQKAESLSADFKYDRWEQLDGNNLLVRFCTSWATTDEQVDSLIAAL